jgi:hypothetical protein
MRGGLPVEVCILLAGLAAAAVAAWLIGIGQGAP